MSCPLCLEKKAIQPVSGKDKRKYLWCQNCYLIYVKKKYLPDPESEKERYLAHENGQEFHGYVEFLNRAIQPSLDYIDASMKGLDYGCGYKPTLSKLLTTYGIQTFDYDPIFFPKGIKLKEYDFIFATECFEHFFKPKKELKLIDELVKPGGYIVMMTALWETPKQFKSWHYTRDFTHVVFYHEKTLQYIEKRFQWKRIATDDERVFIWKKKRND